jgi:hypothetical protein
MALVILGALAANCPANFGEISEMFQIIEGWQNIRILIVFLVYPSPMHSKVDWSNWKEEEEENKMEFVLAMERT